MDRRSPKGTPEWKRLALRFFRAEMKARGEPLRRLPASRRRRTGEASDVPGRQRSAKRDAATPASHPLTAAEERTSRRNLRHTFAAFAIHALVPSFIHRPRDRHVGGDVTKALQAPLPDTDDLVRERLNVMKHRRSRIRR